MITYLVESDDCVLQVYANENVSDQTIIFLHGGPGSGAKAIFELPAFQALEQEYRCVYFDQRGSGNSEYDLKNGLSIDQICNDVAKIVRDTSSRFKQKQIFLWGGSYGGTLGCLYMQTIGSGIDGLILNNPAIFFGPEQAVTFFKRLRDNSLKRMPSEFQNNQEVDVNEMIDPKAELQKKEFVDFVYSPYNPSKSLRHICAMSNWFFNHSYRSLFEKMQTPMLLMLGKEDPICGNDDAKETIENINNANIDLRVISPCGHAIFEDCPKEFVQYTREFLQQYKK